jgi:hypothetical protein
MKTSTPAPPSAPEVAHHHDDCHLYRDASSSYESSSYSVSAAIFPASLFFPSSSTTTTATARTTTARACKYSNRIYLLIHIINNGISLDDHQQRRRLTFAIVVAVLLLVGTAVVAFCAPGREPVAAAPRLKVAVIAAEAIRPRS